MNSHTIDVLPVPPGDCGEPLGPPGGVPPGVDGERVLGEVGPVEGVGRSVGMGVLGAG